MVSELWPGGPLFKEEGDVFRVGADSMLLADFAGKTLIKKKKRAIDLGCGSGVISVLLAWNDPGLHIDGVELSAPAARLARENAALSGFADRISIIEGDLRRHREMLQNGLYDLTVSNPPYNPHGKGKQPVNAERAAARDDAQCSISDLCKAAQFLTRWGGSFALVHRPEWLPEVFRTLSASGFEPKRVRFVQHTQSSPPSLVMIESRRGGNPSLRVEAPLILIGGDGRDTDEVREIYRIRV